MTQCFSAMLDDVLPAAILDDVMDRLEHVLTMKIKLIGVPRGITLEDRRDVIADQSALSIVMS